MPQRLLAAVGLPFNDDELFAVPTHRDDIQSDLQVAGVRELIVALHAVKALRLAVPPNNPEQEDIAGWSGYVFFFEKREISGTWSPGFVAGACEAIGHLRVGFKLHTDGPRAGERFDQALQIR